MAKDKASATNWTFFRVSLVAIAFIGGVMGAQAALVSEQIPWILLLGMFVASIPVMLLVIGLPMILLSPWILSVALILTCGIYVAFEFALVKIPLRELEREAEAGVPGAVQVLGMKRDLNAMLAACQFGITLTSLGLTLALEPMRVLRVAIVSGQGRQIMLRMLADGEPAPDGVQEALLIALARPTR